MPDEDIPAEPAAGQPAPANAPDAGPAADGGSAPEGSSVTPGGYSYEVLADDSRPASPAPAGTRPQPERSGVPISVALGTFLLLAFAVGIAIWLFLARGSGGDDDALTTTGSGLLNAFTAGGESATRRFEGELPPGYPADVPEYSNSTIVSSVLQVSDPNAGFIVVHDSGDDRDTVAEELAAEFDEGSWQVTGGQESRDATLYQFSRTDDADVTGIVLLTQSKDGARTTIITSIQDADGAADIEDEVFELPARGRNVPDGFPSEIAAYEGAVLIESAFQNEGARTSYALSYLTDDDADAVEEFYRQSLEDAGLTVEDGDPANTPLENAVVLSFSNEDGSLEGEIAIGEFSEDGDFTRIDIQVGDERDDADEPADDEPSDDSGDSEEESE